MINQLPLEIPRVTDEKVFEHLCKHLWQNDTSNKNVAINGRRGQNQKGVDIFGTTGSGVWFGVQCKVRQEKLTLQDIQTDVAAAESFNPKLSEMIFCTTAKRDSGLQEEFRVLSDAFKAFTLSLKFWDDIEDELKMPVNRNILSQYYGQFFVSVETLTHSIGRLCVIHLGDVNSFDTQYEILLGKTFPTDSSKTTELNYWKGCYYIMNLNDRKFETFRLPVYPTDIEQAFSNKYDQKRICCWLNKITDMDQFIASTEPTDFSHCKATLYDSECVNSGGK